MEERFDHFEGILEKIEVQGNEIEEIKRGLQYQEGTVEELKEEKEILEKKCRIYEGRLTHPEKHGEDLTQKMQELKCRTMRDNLIFQGIDEKEDATDKQTEDKLREFMMKELKMEEKLVNEISFDCVHRIGRKPGVETKPRRIVSKFNPYQGKESVLAHTKISKEKHSTRYMNNFL